MTDELPRLLYDRFRGREDRYAIQLVDGSYRPQEGALSLALFRSHLQGALTIGVYQLRKDSTCWFGALDFDEPNYASRDAMVQAIVVTSRLLHHFNLSHVIEFSGNKGFHIWHFFAVPVPATKVQTFLRSVQAQVAADMDAPAPMEIFPKQTVLTETSPYGNLIKTPWGVHRKSGQRCWLTDGALVFLSGDRQRQALEEARPLTESDLDEFIEEYPCPETSRPFRKANLNGSKTELFGRGKVPCTTKLLTTDVQEGKAGGRNNRIFDLAVRFYREGELEESALTRLQTYNKNRCKPALPSDEVRKTVRGVYSRGHGSLHCEELSSVCAGAECEIYRSVHGITLQTVTEELGEDAPPPLTDLVKIETDPPTYRCNVDGVAIQLEGDELLKYPAFRSKVFQAINKIYNVPRLPKQAAQVAWEEYLAPLMEAMVVEPAPEDAGNRGRLRAVIADWALKNLRRDAEPESLERAGWVILHRAHPGCVLFRSESLIEYLEKRRIGRYGAHEVWTELRNLGATSVSVKLQNKKGIRAVRLPLEVPEETGSEEGGNADA